MCRAWNMEVGQPAGRDGQHPFSEIQPGYLHAPPGQTQGEVTGATAEVQRVLARLRAGQLDQASLPMPVQAKALEIIDQVIARRDSGKEIVHLRSALVARIEEGVDHSHFAARLQSGKSPLQIRQALAGNRLRAFLELEDFYRNKAPVAHFL